MIPSMEEMPKLTRSAEENQEPHRFDQIVDMGKKLLGRAALILGIVSGPSIAMYSAEVTLKTNIAAAETSTYPDADAVDCSAKFGVFSWCKGDPSMWLSSRGYGYRNCTDWGAYRIQQLTGVSVPKNLGNATTWDTQGKEAGYTVDQIPEPGDIAQNNEAASGYGHLGVVEQVNKDGQGKITSIVVSQYNGDGKGNPATLTYPAESDGTFWLYSDKSQKWDNFIDVNGTGVGINGTAVQSGINPYGAVGEGQELTDDTWVYTKAGGSAWPIKPKSEWTTSDTAYWGNVPFRVSGAEIHDHEAGYTQSGRLYGAHPPVDGTDVYVDGGDGKQWYFVRGHAYPVTDSEIDDLGIRNRALRIPATDGRLGDFMNGNLPLNNRMRYRFAGTALVRLMAQQGGGGFHAFDVNSETLLNCLELIEGGQTIVLPQSARQYTEQYRSDVLVANHQAACQFRPNMILNGPGGAEKWAISGSGDSLPYERHYYPSPLSIYLNSGGQPDYQQLRSVVALNNVVQTNDMGYSDGVFFRNAANGDVFKRDSGQFRKVPNPDVLNCLGNPAQIVVPGEAVVNLPQGSAMACNYEGKLIYGPNGVQYFISQGRRHVVGNVAISSCLGVRAYAGGPIAVSDSVVGSYTNDGVAAYCTYEQEPGLNFLHETADPTVWLVHPDGTKQHVGSLCDIAGKKYQLFEVPRGETGGHRQTSDWFASPANCAALPG